MLYGFCSKLKGEQRTRMILYALRSSKYPWSSVENVGESNNAALDLTVAVINA